VLSADVVAISKVDVIAFDTTFGSIRWTYTGPPGETAGYSPLAAGDSTIFAAGRSGRMHALNARTGTPRWVTDLSGGKPNVTTFNPILSDNRVFVCTIDFDAAPQAGALWALDALTGAVVWSHTFVPEKPAQGSACYGSTAVWGSLVFQAGQDGRVVALDRTAGTVQWTAPAVHHPVSLEDQRWATAAAGIVLTTSLSVPGMIVAYDALTGAELWRRTDYGGSLYPPVLDSTVAYVDHGWIFASYDLATGATRWQTPRSESDPESPLKGRPVIAGDRIFVGGRDGSYALRR
jgi:outer membrane protein assembly factor BamB